MPIKLDRKSFKDFLAENDSKNKSKSGTYVAIKLSKCSFDVFIRLQKILNLKNPLDVNDAHCTVLYSNNVVSNDDLNLSDIESEIDCNIVSIDIFGKESGKSVVVARLVSPNLIKNHQDMIDSGGTHNFDKYECHITLSYDDNVEPQILDNSLPIKLNNIYSTNLKDD